MVRRGDIRNSDYAHKAKTYCWASLSQSFSRNVSPTDVDAAVECNNRFMFFECKTMGKDLDRGQRLFLERLLYKTRLHGTVMILEHPRLEVVTDADFQLISIWRWHTGGIVKTIRHECDFEYLKWWNAEWWEWANEKPNSFERRFLELSGINPPSKTFPFRRVGAVKDYGPFGINGGSRQEILGVNHG